MSSFLQRNKYAHLKGVNVNFEEKKQQGGVLTIILEIRNQNSVNKMQTIKVYMNNDFLLIDSKVANSSKNLFDKEETLM